MKKPHKAQDPYDWSALLELIQAAFGSMEGRIDPPSSVQHLTAATIAEQARTGEIWVIGTPAASCVFLTPKSGALYIGKLAVAEVHRGQGHARRLLLLAEARARTMGLAALELQTRVELVENHAVFRALGFVKTAETAHPGFDRPTSLTFRRPVAP